jgi:plasmid stabilization system protein ParE
VIVFAEEALADLERIFEFNFERDPGTALDHIEKIRSAALLLDAHPEIGRSVPGSVLRELVISYGMSGYIALYQHAPAEGLIRIAAIRHQREAGYRPG